MHSTSTTILKVIILASSCMIYLSSCSEELEDLNHGDCPEFCSQTDYYVEDLNSEVDISDFYYFRFHNEQIGDAYIIDARAKFSTRSRIDTIVVSRGILAEDFKYDEDLLPNQYEFHFKYKTYYFRADIEDLHDKLEVTETTDICVQLTEPLD